jgi:hypothetical protein
MSQPESRLQRRIRAALEARWPTSFWTKYWGGPFTRAGIPDLIGCVQGRFVALEVKRPGEEASRIQIIRMTDLASAGAIVGVVRDALTAVRYVELMIDDHHRWCWRCRQPVPTIDGRCSVPGCRRELKPNDFPT